MPRKSNGPSLLVKDVMEAPVITILADSTIDHVAKLMWEKDIGSAVVVDGDDKMIGIVTERDIIFAVSKGMTASGIPLSSIMSRTKIVAHPDETLGGAVRKMRKTGVKHLPVVDRNKRPVGMFSISDALEIGGPVLETILRLQKRATT